jgi:hypothetical protein
MTSHPKMACHLGDATAADIFSSRETKAFAKSAHSVPQYTGGLTSKIKTFGLQT